MKSAPAMPNNTACPSDNFWLSLRSNPLFRAALIIIATLLAYLPATHGGFIWDDDVYVTENPCSRRRTACSASGSRSIRRRNIFRWFIRRFAPSTRSGG